jgi:Type ISP C-terminal specificity domain
VDGVTAGKIRPELRLIGKPTKTDGSSFNESKGDCDVTARWGITGKGGICIPSNGHTESRAFEDAEAVALLGPDTRDIYLNEHAYWMNVPARVWEYTLGGYQVLKKWLSYREKAILGRGLSIDEVAYLQQVARRIAALLLLGPELDENYRRVKAAAFAWK